MDPDTIREPLFIAWVLNEDCQLWDAHFFHTQREMADFCPEDMGPIIYTRRLDIEREPVKDNDERKLQSRKCKKLQQ